MKQADAFLGECYICGEASTWMAECDRADTETYRLTLSWCSTCVPNSNGGWPTTNQRPYVPFNTEQDFWKETWGE